MIFRQVMMGYLTLMLMGITSYLLVPASGPARLSTTFTKPRSPERKLALAPASIIATIFMSPRLPRVCAD